MKSPHGITSTSLVLILSLFLGDHVARGIETSVLGTTNGPCDNRDDCGVDGYVGSSVIYEDDHVRIWDFKLEPGQTTSMHRHDYPYHFVALNPTQLEVFGQNGTRLFDFRAEGVLGFDLDGDVLKPIGIELPWPVPRVHSAKNIGTETYHELLFETKKPGGLQSNMWWKKFLPKKKSQEL